MTELTIDEVGVLLGEEETDHHSNESDPCTNISPVARIHTLLES
jgi:hypothetical protein